MCCRPGAGGEESREVFEAAMKTVDATFQNLDSSEISLTDVSHYFDSDPTKLVAGLRSDGKMPSAYIADTTTANAQVLFRPSPYWSKPYLGDQGRPGGRQGWCKASSESFGQSPADTPSCPSAPEHLVGSFFEVFVVTLQTTSD